MASAHDHVEVVTALVGEQVLAGVLRIHERRGQSSSFEYDRDYIGDPRAYELDPQLPLVSGPHSPPLGTSIANAFSDSAPDRWGRALMARAERDRARTAGTTPRSLGDVDFLLGTRDDLRQGAIRFRDPSSGAYLADEDNGVPALVDLPRLLRASGELNEERLGDQAIKDLIEAGGSLGGARPKASVRLRDGRLAIAKFPRGEADDWDVEAWEAVEAELAERSGIRVAKSVLHKIAGCHVLLVERFDREGPRRIGFASALTMLEANDQESRSYLEIAEVIERRSLRVNEDLEELFRRIVFSVLTSNSDDHLRNHGFLRRDRDWRLSPAYDMNPNADAPGTLTTTINLDDPTASIELVLEVAGYFRLDANRALAIVAEVERATADWRVIAARLGLKAAECARMELAFDGVERSVARRITGRSSAAVRQPRG